MARLGTTGLSEKLGLDPDLHWSVKLDPDPNLSDADPQPCNQLQVFLFLLGMVRGSGSGNLDPDPHESDANLQPCKV